MSETQELPEGWVWTKVAALGAETEQAVLTGPFGASLGREDFVSDGIPVLTIGCLTDAGLSLEKAVYVRPEKANELDRYRVRGGDILFSRMASVGRSDLVTLAFDGALINYHLMRLRLNDELIDPHYFVYYVRGFDGVTDYVRDVNHGATRDGINTQQLLSLPVLLPPLAEQRRIVAAIEQQFTRLDAGVAALRRARVALKRYRAAVLKAAVEGRLTEQWRAEHPDVEAAPVLLGQILGERRLRWEADLRARGKDAAKARYEEPKGPDVGSLPGLPEGWCWATVAQIIQRSEYGTSIKCAYEAKGIPVLRIPNIAAGEIDLSDVKYATVPLHMDKEDELLFGDVLMCRTNGSVSLIGKTAVIKYPFDEPHTFASYLLRFRFATSRVLPNWYHLFASSPQGRKFIEGNAASSAGQHNISLSLIHRLSLPLPPLAEQEQIVAEVERRLSVVGELEATVEANLKRAERLRQSILREAFAGRLVAQDASDEAAGVLVERIRGVGAQILRYGSEQVIERITAQQDSLW